MSATRLLNFRDSDLQTPNGSLEVAGGLTLDNTVTPTTLRQLVLSLHDLEPAEEKTDLWDMQQGEYATRDPHSLNAEHVECSGFGMRSHIYESVRGA